MKQNLTVNFTSDGCFFGTPRMHKLDTILQTAVLESIFLHHHDHNKQVNIPFPSHRNKVFCQTLLCLNGSACKRHNTNLKFNKQSTVPRSCNHVLFVKKSANIPAASAAHVIINITERFFSPRQCFPNSSALVSTCSKSHNCQTALKIWPYLTRPSVGNQGQTPGSCRSFGTLRSWRFIYPILPAPARFWAKLTKNHELHRGDLYQSAKR